MEGGGHPYPKSPSQTKGAPNMKNAQPPSPTSRRINNGAPLAGAPKPSHRGTILKEYKVGSDTKRIKFVYGADGSQQQSGAQVKAWPTGVAHQAGKIMPQFVNPEPEWISLMGA